MPDSDKPTQEGKEAPPAPQVWGEDALQPGSVSPALAGQERSTDSAIELPPPRIGGPGGPSARIALLAYVAFGVLLPLTPLPHHAPPRWVLFLLLTVPTAVFMLLQLWLARTVVALRPRGRLCVALMGLAVVLWGVSLLFLHPVRGLPYAVNFPLALLRPTALNLWLTLACTFGGILLSRIVREPNVLLPVALFAMPIDYIGAMTPVGFTHTVETRAPQIAQAVSVAVPGVGHLRPVSFVGPGDALFIAFFLALTLRLQMNPRGTFAWMYGLLTAAMLLVLLLPNFNVAALVPMGLAVLIANWRFFRFTRAEGFATLYAGALVLTVVMAFYVYAHAHLFRH